MEIYEQQLHIRNLFRLFRSESHTVDICFNNNNNNSDSYSAFLSTQRRLNAINVSQSQPKKILNSSLFSSFEQLFLLIISTF